MKRTILSLAAAAAVTAGAATMLAPAPATADPLTDLIGSRLAGSSDGGNAQPNPGGPSSNGVTSIEMTVERYSYGGFGGAGKKLGPDLYTFSDGRFEPGIEYNARTAAGGTNRADNCQIEIQVTGPQTSSVVKTAKCNGYKGTGVITKTGRYTAIVTDRVARASFSIE